MRRTIELLWELSQAVRGLPDVTRQRRVVAYEVDGPTTIYVRASHSRVSVLPGGPRRVQLEFDLRQSFGWRWLAERDEVGIYIVLKRRPVVGALSYAQLTLTAPPDSYLVFNLTPGSVYLEHVEGQLAINPAPTTPPGA